MKNLTLLSLFALFAPAISCAQNPNVSAQNMLVNIVEFVNEVLIPFLLGIGFLFFVVNAVRYFVIGGNNEQEQEKAKALALYSVLAFVIIITFWGIVNMLASGIGLEGECQPRSDYYMYNFVGPPAPCP